MHDDPDSDNANQGKHEEHVLQLAAGLVASHALHMVATLGIADLLGDTTRSVDTAPRAAA